VRFRDCSEDIGNRPLVVYKNSEGETVSWVFDGMEAIEHDPKFEDGGDV